jgi:hypothetical protein
MSRARTAVSIVSISSAGVVVGACDGRVAPSPVVALVHDEAGAPAPADAGRLPLVVPPPKCEGRCCPTAPECFPQQNPSAYSGAECLAERDNTGQKLWQFRQTLSVSTRPPGNAVSLIADNLASRSELKWPACGSPSGTSGFIQLMELDREHDTSRVGFARFEPDPASALKDGLCFVEDTYSDPKWGLGELYTPEGWPAGLPAPMPQPWKVAVVNATRLRDATGKPVEFDVKRDRAALLSRFEPGKGDLDGKFNGVFSLDDTTGTVHGYAPVAFIVLYDDRAHYDAIPIRETEIRTQLNDPAHPNCAGSLLGDNPALPNACTGNSTNRLWGCSPGNCADGVLGQTIVEGYFLVAELEQIYNSVLGQTLCFSFPGPDGYQGWKLDKSCRSGAGWNPKDPIHGLPPGDWCAATNGPATPQCHDAWKSISYSTFQAFPIRAGTCAAK